MAHKVDYAELRKIYFNYQPDAEPSHSSNEIKNFANDNQLNIHHLMTMLTDTEKLLQVNDVENSLAGEDWPEIGTFKSKLSPEANEILNKLYEKYGAQIYPKIIQLIKEKEFIQWSQLETELLTGNLMTLIEKKEAPIFIENEMQSANLAEDFSHTDDDLDYLDALVKQDYRRLNQSPSDKGDITSIFSEILENEHDSHSNYQDDVFEKNIELIFNSDIDLDEASDINSSESDTLIPSFSLAKSLNENEPTPVELLQNLEDSVPSELFQDNGADVLTETSQIMTENEAIEVQDIKKEEKVMIKKVVVKKRANDNISLGIIVLSALVVILMIAVITLGYMVFG